MLASLVDLGWKSLLVAGLALLAHAAMRRRPAAERAALLQAALLALLALPLLAPLLPALDLAWLPALHPAPGGAAPPHARTMVATAAAPVPGMEPADAILALYATGVAVLLLRFVAGLWTLMSWTRAARPPLDPRWQRTLDREAVGLRRPLRLLVSSYAVTPLSWGIAPAAILIGPATHDRPEQAEAVIAHELAHIRRFDWLGLVVARIATALVWFNPLAWLIARELAREVELAADAEALGRIDRYDYAQALLAVAGGGLAHRDANGMAFTRTALARRIAVAIEDGTGRRMRPLVPAILLLAALGAAGPLAAARIVRARPLPVAPVPLAPAAPIAPVAPQPMVRTMTSPNVVQRVGHAAGALLKSLNAGLRASPSRPAMASPGVAKSVAAPSPTALHIVGHNGAEVTAGPNGVTLIGAAPEEQGAAERQRGEQEARQGKIDGMRGAAVGLRAGAEEAERVAADPGTPPDVRVQQVIRARNLRAQAGAFEDQANKLTSG